MILNTNKARKCYRNHSQASERASEEMEWNEKWKSTKLCINAVHMVCWKRISIPYQMSPPNWATSPKKADFSIFHLVYALILLLKRYRERKKCLSAVYCHSLSGVVQPFPYQTDASLSFNAAFKIHTHKIISIHTFRAFRSVLSFCDVRVALARRRHRRNHWNEHTQTHKKSLKNENHITVACKATKLFHLFIEFEMKLRSACNSVPSKTKCSKVEGKAHAPPKRNKYHFWCGYLDGARQTIELGWRCSQCRFQRKKIWINMFIKVASLSCHLELTEQRWSGQTDCQNFYICTRAAEKNANANAKYGKHSVSGATIQRSSIALSRSTHCNTHSHTHTIRHLMHANRKVKYYFLTSANKWIVILRFDSATRVRNMNLIDVEFCISWKCNYLLHLWA